MKATPAQQRALLDVQNVDTRLSQVSHRRANLTESARREQLVEKLAELNTELALAQAQIGDIGREVARAEDDVAAVRKRIDRDRALIDSGSITDAKQLTDLQHEVESLRKRQTDLEDVELAVMERAEEVENKVGALSADLAKTQAELDQVSATEAELLTEIDAEVADLSADRDALLPQVGPELLGLYEKVRATSGIGAAPLVGGRCEGCHMQLPPTDLRAIEAAAEDDVVRCEECRCILVRP